MSKTPETPADTYETVSVRYRELRERLTAARAEIRDLEVQRYEAQQKLDDAARAVWDGDDSSISVDVDDEIRKAKGKVAVLERAVEIARVEVGAHKKARNRAVVKELRPEHRHAAARVLAAVKELASANEAESKIRARAPGNVLPCCAYPGIGLGRPDTPTAFFIRHVKNTYPGVELAEAAE